MADNKKRKLRSMSEAVEEITRDNPGQASHKAADEKRQRAAKAAPKNDEPAPRRRRSEREPDAAIHNMREAVDEITGEARDERRSDGDDARNLRVYGNDGAHRADANEKRPSRTKKRRKKKKRSLASRLIGEKRLRRDRDKPLTVWGIQLSFWPMFILAFIVIMITAMLMDSANLVTDQQQLTIMGVPSDLEGYRLLVLSDLNGRRFGDKQVTLLRQIEALNYDIVVCLGDMVGKDGDPEPFYELLEGLPSRAQVYFICGDSDPGPYTKTVRGENAPLSQLVLEDWILGAVERGAIYVDRPVSIAVGDARIWLSPSDMLNMEASENLNLWKDQAAQEESGYLAGVAADTASLPFTSYRLQRAQALLDSINSMADGDLHISLSHVPAPDSFITAADVQAEEDAKFLPAPDIALAGHYCGGVWNLPLLGAFYIPDSSAERYGWFPAQDEAGGLRQVEDTLLYVSRGLSTCGDVPLMPFRLLNNPQVSVLTITATLPSSMLE
jgi:predicted MPP superfamily phosphohydrolase